MTRSNETRFASILLVAAICFGQLNYSYAATIFSENYEVTQGDVKVGNAPYNDLVARGWIVDPKCNGYCSISIVPAPPGRSGSVLRFTSAESVLPPSESSGDDPSQFWAFFDSSHDALLERRWPGASEIYERYYLRFETVTASLPSPFTGGPGYKQHYFNTSVLPNFYTIMTDGGVFSATNQSAVTHLCPPDSFGSPGSEVTCNLEQNVGRVSIPHGVWACIETHFSQSAVEIWVNGRQVMSYTGNVLFPSAYNEVTIYRQGFNNEYRYEDDYIVATTRIGCPGTPTVSSVPPPPTGLRFK